MRVFRSPFAIFRSASLMKFLFSLLLLLSVARISQAQTTLKAGTYRNLESTPLVLDTGDFVLVNVEIRSTDPRQTFLLDARKARSLRLDHCRLLGRDGQTGILLSCPLILGHSRFEHLDTALQWKGTETRELRLYRNQFENNRVAIDLENVGKKDPLYVSLSLKCNEFRPRKDSSGTGLRIGQRLVPGYTYAEVFIPGRIGGNGHDFYSGNDYPNGNRWPEIRPGQDWISIENLGPRELAYTAYRNEEPTPLKGAVFWQQEPSSGIWKLDAGTVTDTCVYAAQQPKGQRNPMVCEQLVDEQPFLLPTHIRAAKGQKAPADSLSVAWQELEIRREAKKAILRVYVPRNNRGVHLQYLSAGSEVLQTNLLARTGWLEVELDLALLEPGAYKYRLYTVGKVLTLRDWTW